MLSFIPIFFVRARESNQTIFLHKHLPTVSVQWRPTPPPLSTYVQLCPLQTSTYVQLCPPPTVHYRCLRFLPPAPPADAVAIMERLSAGHMCPICTYMFQLDYRRISPTQQQSTQQFHTLSRWPRRLSIEYPCHQGLQKQSTLNTLDTIWSEVCCIKSVATPTKL